MKIGKVGLLILMVYIASRLVALTKLPVFADEAIYIRWAQMIVDDPKENVFLPLYDGKSPLFIWGLIPLVNHPGLDPLMMGRLLSVVSGAVFLIGIRLITKESGGSKIAQLLSMGLVVILPFTFFYSRMALIDILLTVFLAFSYWSYLRSRNLNYNRKWIWLSGVFWGLALMTKTSAFYFLPVIGGTAMFDLWRNKRLRKFSIFFSLASGLIIGLGFIGWMRISPLFPFLFQRSSDFAHPINEIFRQWSSILSVNIYRIGKWLTIYLTPGLLVLFISGVLIKSRRHLGILVWGTFLFLLPFLITGKLLSSRYFLPVVIWLIPLAALVLEKWYIKNKIIFFGFAVGITIFCLRFIYPLYTDPGRTPFPNEDVVQYLTEWSAGYGIPEVRDFLTQRANDHKIYVATEGYFGTLPDGLFIYFNHSGLQNNLEIHGIGQPISDIRQDLLTKAETEEVYLVVNAHRFTMDANDPRIILIGSYPRPRQGPSLLLYRIKP